MIKGGYKIVNFNGAALSGTAVELSGIYAQIVDDYDKPVIVSGVSLNGDIMDDAYAGVQEKTTVDTSKYVELTVYGGIITVTEDDEVSFVLSKTTAELTAEIGDLEDLETTEKNSVVGAINEVKNKLTPKYGGTQVSITAASAKTTLTNPFSEQDEGGYILFSVTGGDSFSGFVLINNFQIVSAINNGRGTGVLWVNPDDVIEYRTSEGGSYVVLTDEGE